MCSFKNPIVVDWWFQNLGKKAVVFFVDKSRLSTKLVLYTYGTESFKTGKSFRHLIKYYTK